MTNIKKLEYAFGGVSGYTPSAAKDFLDGISAGGNKSMRIYRNNEVVSSGLVFIESNGFFEGNTKFYPFIDEESQYMIDLGKIQNGIWSFAIEGMYFNNFIKKARFIASENKEIAVQQMVTASLRDKEKYGERIKFFARCQTLDKTRTLTLIVKEQAYLSALVAVSVAKLILSHRVISGCYPLISINVPKELYDSICQDSEVCADFYEYENNIYEGEV